MNDIYSLNVVGTPRKMCGGGNDPDGDSEACVTVSPISGAPGAVALGDSKDPARPLLRFTAAEMSAFVKTYAEENGITL